MRFFAERGAIASASSDRADAREVRDALLDFLAQSPADFALVNIEDLWLETSWRNVPGTMDEHPNWRRRLRYDLAQIAADTSVEAVCAA